MATHSSITACRLPWTEEPGGLKVHGVTKNRIQLSDAGRDWGQEEKGTTEDEMAGWHH